MIKEFIERFEKNKPKIDAAFRSEHPGDYSEIVRLVVESFEIDEFNVCEIPNGRQSGESLFVISSQATYPDAHWFVMVKYGSCTVCDTLMNIRWSGSDGGNSKPTGDQVSGYMKLALHIAQGIKVLE